MTAQLFLGIEGGATRTTGVLADAPMRVLARHEAGPSNLHAVGRADARAAVAGILDHLLTAADADWQRVAAAAFCMAGLRSGDDRDEWQRLADECGVRAACVLTHDAAAGLAAGCPERVGVLVVCGTGSFVYGRAADGREHFVGGRGPALGDEAGGFDIAHRALRAAARAADGRGPDTKLRQLLPARLGAADLDGLVAWANPLDKARIAGAAPIVFEAADGGDDVARGIIAAAAAELARCVGIVADTLWPGRDGGSSAPGDWPGRAERVVLAGGVFCGQAAFRGAVSAAVRTFLPDARCALADVEGAVGAARIARATAAGRRSEG